MKLHARLRRLERTTVDADCPACRERRGWTVLLTARRLPDGTVAPVEGEPQPCVRCGQVPEQIIEVVEVIEPAAAEWSSPS